MASVAAAGVPPGPFGSIMHDGLCDTVKHHADTNTCGKQHREPGYIAISRFCMVWPKLNLSMAGYRKIEDDHGGQNHDQRKTS